MIWPLVLLLKWWITLLSSSEMLLEASELSIGFVSTF